MRTIRTGLRSRHLRELALFCLVGASGYVVNLVVFQCVYSAGAGHLAAAMFAFLVAATNNYLLNRRWTFEGASGTAKRIQAPRFLGRERRRVPPRPRRARGAR